MVATRFAPSPTGYLHIGGLRTALFNYLWARKNQGAFKLRIEDTDLQRNSQEATEAILEAFRWCGLDYDDDVVYQSERFAVYRQYIDRLIEEGKAYYCYMRKEELDALRSEQMARKERPRYDGRYRDFDGTPPEGIDPVVRIKAPLSGRIAFEDGVKGWVGFDASEVDDFIIARSDGTPTYNFVVTVDDALMQISDVIRGDDHLSNTPKQVVVYQALGFKLPKFYHVPMIHGSDGKKLSKRHGATDATEYKRMGYLPEALLNFLVRLGWSYGDQEIFSLEEMIEKFDPAAINSSASAYNADKLLWLNAHYIKNSTNDRLANALEAFDLYLVSHDKREILLDLFKERAKTLAELAALITEIVETPETYDAKAFKKAIKGDTRQILEAFVTYLNSVPRAHLPTDFHELLHAFVQERGIGFGKIGMPLRVALVGRLAGPELGEIMSIIGTDETIERIEHLLKRVKEQQ